MAKRLKGRIAQPSYMAVAKFRKHCTGLGLVTGVQQAAFFKVHSRTVAGWRLGQQPISASTAMLLGLMAKYKISISKAQLYLDD